MSKPNKILLTEGAVDLIVLYTFLKKLTTPFDEWPAFKLGIIDDEGKVLRKRATLTEPEERRSFTLFDILVLNIKKAIQKLPGGKTKLATFVAGLFLMREQRNEELCLHEDLAWESYMDFLDIVSSDPDLKKEVDALMKKIEIEEDAPVNSISGGGVAGLTIATGGPVIKRTIPDRKKQKSFKEYSKPTKE